MPGEMVLARMPAGPPSTASWRVSPRTADLPAQWATMPKVPLPRKAFTEAKLTIEPPPVATMCGHTAWTGRKTTSTSPRNVGAHCASKSISAVLAMCGAIAPAVTSASTRPCRAYTSSANLLASAGTDMSSGASTSSRRPRSAAIVRVCPAASVSMSQPTTVAPWSAKSSAHPWPIPAPAPVTRTALPESLPGTTGSGRVCRESVMPSSLSRCRVRR